MYNTWESKAEGSTSGNLEEIFERVCEGEQMLLYATGDEKGTAGSSFKLPKDVSIEVGEGTNYGYFILQAFFSESLYAWDGQGVIPDQPGVSYL